MRYVLSQSPFERGSGLTGARLTYIGLWTSQSPFERGSGLTKLHKTSCLKSRLNPLLNGAQV